ncbi:hypothetical protein AABB24_016633, partial [Solanum stoloniferum]
YNSNSKTLPAYTNIRTVAIPADPIPFPFQFQRYDTINNNLTVPKQPPASVFLFPKRKPKTSRQRQSKMSTNNNFLCNNRPLCSSSGFSGILDEISYQTQLLPGKDFEFGNLWGIPN